MLWGGGGVEKQEFFFRSVLLYSDVSKRNVPKMKPNPFQMTASFEWNLLRHIAKHKSSAIRDVRVWFEICIGRNVIRFICSMDGYEQRLFRSALTTHAV